MPMDQYSQYIYPTGDPVAEQGNILAQGLQAIIANQERDRGLKAMAKNFEGLGPEGQNIAQLMVKDPRAAHRAFEMFGGADNVYKQIQARQSSRSLAEAMTNVQSQRGVPNAGFDYPDFIRSGLSMGVPLHDLSNAASAIAQGSAVNTPQIGQTEDWSEQNGQAMRRRIFYDKKSGRIIKAGEWSPAFRPPTGRVTRINPKTGQVEIFEGLTSLQQSNVMGEDVGSQQGVETGGELLGTLERSPGVSGISGALGEFASGLGYGAAALVNNLAGEEVVPAEATEDQIANAFMAAPPEVRSRYKTNARNFETRVRKTMELGKPSDRDMALVEDAAAALSTFRSPRSIAAAVEQFTYLDLKYSWLRNVAISAPVRYDLREKEGMRQVYYDLISAGVSKERAEDIAIRVHKSVVEQMRVEDYPEPVFEEPDLGSFEE